MCGVNDWSSLWAVPALGQDKSADVSGHLERRGHIAHIKGVWESRSVCSAAGWWRGMEGSSGRDDKEEEEDSEGKIGEREKAKTTDTLRVK